MDSSGFNDEAEMHQDNTGFQRLIRNMAWSQNYGGPGISEANFLDNSFFSVWDISTARSPPTDYSMSKKYTRSENCVWSFLSYFSNPDSETRNCQAQYQFQRANNRRTDHLCALRIQFPTGYGSWPQNHWFLPDFPDLNVWFTFMKYTLCTVFKSRMNNSN